MVLNVGDLITVLRFRDEATPQVVQALGNLRNLAVTTASALQNVLTPAIQATAKAASSQLTPALNGAAAAMGGSTGGSGGGSGAASGAAANLAFRLNALGHGMQQAGQIATVGFTAPILGAAAASIKFGKDFEAAMARTVSLAAVSKEEVGAVGQKLLELAPIAGIGPVALAQGMYAVSSTMEDTSVAMDIVTRSAKLSAAGLGETKVVARALTTVINAYGKENMTAARAGDVLVRAIRDGGAEASELAPTIADVVPVAAKLGVSFEQLAANIAVVTKLGVPTGEAVTQVTSVFASLFRETNRGSEALATIGMSYKDLREMLKGPEGLIGVLTLLSEKFGVDDGRLFDVVGRLEALKNVLGTTGAMANTYAKEVTRMYEATGEADQAFQAISGTFEHQWNQMVASLQVLAIDLSKTLFPILKDLLKIFKDDVIPIVKDMIYWFQQLPQGMQGGIIAIVTMTALLGPFLKAGGMVLTLVSSLGRAIGVATASQGFTALKAFFGITTIPLTAPLIALVTALTALGIAAYKIGQSDVVKDFLAKWLLTGDTISAQGLRWAMGIQHMSDAEAEASLKTAALTRERIELNETLKEAGIEVGKLAPKHNGVTAALAKEALGIDEVLKLSRETIVETQDWSKELKELEASYRSLSGSQKRDIQLGTEMGKSLKEIVEKTGATEYAVKKYQEVLKDAAKETEKMAELQKKLEASARSVTANGWVPLKAAIEDNGVAIRNIAAGFEENGDILNKNTEEYKKAAAEAAKETAEWVRQNGMLKQTIEDNKPALENQQFQAEQNAEAIQKAKDSLNDIANALRRLGQVSGDGFGGVAQAIAEMVASVNVAFKAVDTMKEGFGQLTSQSKNVVLGLANIGQGAIAAAAGLLQATGAGSTLQRSLGGIGAGAALGAGIGGMFGPLGATIGKWIGGIGGGLIGIFRGQSAAKKAAAEAAKKLAEETAKMAAEAVKATDAFKKQHPEIKSVAEMAKLLGINLQEVRTQADLDILNGQLAEMDEKLGDINDEMVDLLDEADELGIGLPQTIQDALLHMAELGLVTGETAERLRGMLRAGEVDYKKMKEAADRYKISEHSLGAGFKQAKINDAAKQIINDYDLLTRGGADALAVIDGMAEEISALVQQSIAFGTTIPDNMRPWIQHLIDTKQLVDENGELITDMGKIRFGAAIETQFEELIRKLDEFIAKLASLPGLFGNATNASNNLPTPGSGGTGGGGTGGGENYDLGGGANSSGAFSYGGGASTASADGGSSQSYRLAIQVDGKNLTDVVINNLNGRLSVRGGR